MAEALEHIRESQTTGRIVYFYVVDADDRLVGVVPTRRLLLSPVTARVRDIMVRSLITLPDSATLLDACEFFILHRLLALPVVDNQGRIQGVVDVELYTDELSDLAERAESDDVFQLIGVHLATIRQATAPAAFRQRFPWLLCNIAGGIACAAVAAWFADVLDRVLLLALFIPVVLALAESVSIQSLTLTLQLQHQRRPDWRALGLALWRELPVGGLLGLTTGGVVAVVVALWHTHVPAAGVVLAAIGLSVATAALFGTLVPALLHLAQRDPKVASGPVVLAMTDLATMFWYLGLATWWL